MEVTTRQSGAADIRLLLLVPALLLLLIPLLGHWQINSTTRLLHEQQIERAELTLARAKHLIESDPALLQNPGLSAANSARLYVHAANARHSTQVPEVAIELDGQDKEWQQVAPVPLDREDLVQVNFPYEDDSLTASLRLQQTDQTLYLFVSVTDDVVVFREIANISIHRNDHLRLGLMDRSGDFQRYTLATEQPGSLFGRVVTSGGRSLRPEARIEAFWRATDGGYDVEIAIDRSLVDHRFALNIADVDDFNTRDILYLMGNSFTDKAEDLGYLISPSPALGALFESLQFEALAFTDTMGNTIASHRPLTSPDRTLTTAVIIDSQRVGELALGLDFSTTQLVRQKSYRELFLVSVVSLGFGLAVCYWIALRILARLRGLGQQLEGVVDEQGRVRQAFDLHEAERGQDAIGELASRFANVTQRLQQYNDYLENLSRRLAHELRTPVSVVRSSLEHLESQVTDDTAPYLARAKNGVQRLTSILNSMSEAARLEQSLDKDEVEVFDLVELLQGCYEGYDHAFDSQPFELSIETDQVKITGIPEIFAQMLDKLVDNAVQFSEPNQPVILRLTAHEDSVLLRVSNSGPNLPEVMSDQLFDPMISLRDEAQRQDSHLGLGLHVARLIAQFHGGSIQLSNRQDREGVVATVRLPLLRLTSKLK